MSHLWKQPLLALGLVLGLGGGAARAEVFVNDGGDEVRLQFIDRAQQIFSTLETTEVGHEILAAHGLDLPRLKSLVTIKVIQVKKGPLVDEGGSVVIALGAPGKIILDRDAWIEQFDFAADVTDTDVLHTDLLIFHELLRAGGYDDNDYRISLELKRLTLPQLKRRVGIDDLRMAFESGIAIEHRAPPLGWAFLSWSCVGQTWERQSFHGALLPTLNDFTFVPSFHSRGAFELIEEKSGRNLRWSYRYGNALVGWHAGDRILIEVTETDLVRGTSLRRSIPSVSHPGLFNRAIAYIACARVKGELDLRDLSGIGPNL